MKQCVEIEMQLASANECTKCELIANKCLYNRFCTFTKAALFVYITLNAITCPTVEVEMFVEV